MYVLNKQLRRRTVGRLGSPQIEVLMFPSFKIESILYEGGTNKNTYKRNEFQ